MYLFTLILRWQAENTFAASIHIPGGPPPICTLIVNKLKKLKYCYILFNYFQNYILTDNE